MKDLPFWRPRTYNVYNTLYNSVSYLYYEKLFGDKCTKLGALMHYNNDHMFKQHTFSATDIFHILRAYYDKEPRYIDLDKHHTDCLWDTFALSEDIDPALLCACTDNGRPYGNPNYWASKRFPWYPKDLFDFLMFLRDYTELEPAPTPDSEGVEIVSFDIPVDDLAPAPAPAFGPPPAIFDAIKAIHDARDEDRSFLGSHSTLARRTSK